MCFCIQCFHRLPLCPCKSPLDFNSAYAPTPCPLPPSDDDETVLVEGLWDPLGLTEQPDVQAAGGSDGGDSGGSTDYELYDALLASYQKVDVAPPL